MEKPHIDVVVRCRNEMPFVVRTLAGLRAQRGCVARVVFFDCGSTDGSREAALEHGHRIIDVEPSTYKPGAVLNHAMRETTSPIVAFINADAVPCSESALTALVDPFAADSSLAATFGRQIARPSAAPDVKLDYERAFGKQGAVAVRYGSFFSMAASAVRRAVWEQQPFDDSLRYSEDVEWTSRLRHEGWTTQYVAGAAYEHSHDYSIKEHFARRRGEGAADAVIHQLDRARSFDDFVKPLAGAVLRDVRAGIASPRSVAVRAAQATGYFVGRARSRA